MALNLTPDYFEADRKYRQARTPAEKLAALEEMLRTIPKHKASEKKQSDLKRRISELRQGELQKTKKSTGLDPYHIERQGAGQAILIGPPNSGKSSIVGILTKAPVKITDFPYGTAVPVPGMSHFEDVPIELVDMPPVTPDHIPGGLVNAARNADAVLIVIDLTSESVLEDLEGLLGALAEKDITFGSTEADGEEEMRFGPEGIILCNKSDLPGTSDTFETLKELRPAEPEMMMVSGRTGENLDVLMRKLFGVLDVIRVYSKEPGRPVDRDKPFILPAGSTVEELARHIHKDLATNLKYARVWGEKTFDGQQVHGKYGLHDRDVVEIHA
ncbi:MAG: TGS domain-containing protein [Planctomycetes bacterium]|nr:TGS domain-containing protein [Planctomycetota bacterium]